MFNNINSFNSSLSFQEILDSDESYDNTIINSEKNENEFFPPLDWIACPENKYLIHQNIKLEENIKVNNESKNVFKVNIKKRGRKKLNDNQKGVHGNDTFDNLERKIQVHFLTFVINFCNDALKTEYGHFNYTFKQINYKDKTTINQGFTSFLKQSSIKDLLRLEISTKYKRYDRFENKKILDKIISTSKWLNSLYEMNYLQLFFYYYNKGESLNKIIFENKEIILSSKTETFFDLISKNKNIKLRKEINDAMRTIYFNGYNVNGNYFSTIIMPCPCES